MATLSHLTDPDAWNTKKSEPLRTAAAPDALLTGSENKRFDRHNRKYFSIALLQ